MGKNMNKLYVCVLAGNDESIHVDVVPESSEVKITFNTAEGKTQYKLVFYEEYKDKTSAYECKHEIDSWMKLIIKKEVDICNPQWKELRKWISLN